MVITPTASFTIPSIHDDSDLECRVYHPPTFSNHGIIGDTWRKKGAVIAHPYAPLGGCFDDPVVQAATQEILKQGFVVGLFNFRGAGESKGRTSWTAKPEHQDYISFIGFLVYYIEELDPIASAVAPSPSSSKSHHLSPIPSVTIPTTAPKTTLLLGGYSYGSLITCSLPSIESVIPIFTYAAKGSAQAEIRLRATYMSRQWNTEIRRNRRRGRTLNVESPHESCTSVYGGEECEPGTRRASRESRRSLDVVRRSMDRSRARLSLKTRSSGDLSHTSAPEERLPLAEVPSPNTIYLLISPLLYPVSLFLTMFTKKWSAMKESQPPPSPARDPDSSSMEEKLSAHQCLAVYGDKDFFTSQRKLRKWAERQADKTESRFTFSEISGAGHFWNEEGSDLRMRETIRAWLYDIQDV